MTPTTRRTRAIVLRHDGGSTGFRLVAGCKSGLPASLPVRIGPRDHRRDYLLTLIVTRYW